MKHIFLLLISILLLNAQELVLDNLLKEYEDSESLYKQTKQDSAGFLLVYSREDIERMQAFSLRDILKTIRMYTMQVQMVGVTRVQKVGQGKSGLSPIKLYIDDFEVTSVAQANALDTYGEMDIYFVDHIEVYQGGSSIAFGNEPGSMVIRLYSKEPSRENSSSVQLTVDSKSSADLRVVDAGSTKDFDYLFYANGAQTNYEKYERNSQELSRDAQRYQAHFKVSKKDDFEVALDVISGKTDIFNGMGQAPTGDYSQRDYGYINAIKHFDGNIRLSAAASIERKKFKNSDAIGIQLPTDTKGNPTANDLEVDLQSNTYKIILDKKIITGKHDLLLGAQFQQNNLNPKTYEGTNIVPEIGPTKLDVYMIYLEELYNLDENNLLTFSAKLDHYRDDFSKNSTEYALRLGYISLIDKNYKAKLFAIHRYTYPNMLQTTYSPPVYRPNPELDSMDIDMITGEVEYYNDNSRALFGYAYKEATNGIVFDKTTKMYVNNKETIDISRIYLRGEHKLDRDNKVILEYFKGYMDNYSSPGSGVLVQLFNKLGAFDIYNELIYREGYSLDYGAGEVDIDAGYDYSLAIAYPITRNAKVKLKGENLLDKTSETLVDTKGDVMVPAIEQRVMLTGEYTF